MSGVDLREGAAEPVADETEPVLAGREIGNRFAVRLSAGEQEHVGARPAFEVVCAAAAVQVVVAAAPEQEVSEAAARKRVVALVAEAPHARAAEELASILLGRV